MAKMKVTTLKGLALCALAIAIVACALAALASPQTARAEVRRAAPAKSAPLQLVRRKPVARAKYVRHKVYRRVRKKKRVWRRPVHWRRRPVVARRPAAPVKERRAPPTPSTADSHGAVLTIAAGNVDGTDAQIASDIVAVADAPGLRIWPVLSRSTADTLESLATSPYIDVALAHSDALDQERAKNPAFDKEIGYIARLFDEEVCALAGPQIRSIRQLEGKKVAVGVAGSGAAITAANVFGKLGIHPVFVNMDTAAELAALDRGEIAAAILVSGKPAPALLAQRTHGVHLLPIPYDPALQREYYPAKLTHADYPRLVPAGPGVDSIAVATLLVAPINPADSARAARIADFARSFLTHFDALLAPGRHPKWREVNLAADAPGWTRIDAAKEWLDSAQADQRQQFNAFLASQPPQKQELTQADHDKLFREFVQWKRTQAQ